MEFPFQIMRRLFVAFLWFNGFAVVCAAIIQLFVITAVTDLLVYADAEVLWWYASFLYAAGQMVVVVIALSPAAVLTHHLIAAFVIPDTLHDFGEMLCNEALTKSVIYRGKYPGGFYLKQNLIERLERNTQWAGSCAFKTGRYGWNGGPVGEDFYVTFYLGDSNEPGFTVNLNFDLQRNIIKKVSPHYRATFLQMDMRSWSREGSVFRL